MLDRFYMPVLGLAALAAVALALVWPQGLGDRSPGPFGHEPVERTPEARAIMKRATEASERRIGQARDALRKLQAQTIAPSQ